jgi:probable HAF family extracellular repeat protein
MKHLSTALLLAAAATLAQAQSITNLGTLPGGNYSNAWGISADGSVVVGFSDSTNGGRAFRWTSAGMTDLGTLPGGNSSEARGVSADGSFVVGTSTSASGGRAFRWTSAGMTDLGTLPGGNYSYAWGISADGSVVVGYSNSANGGRAFRWTSAGMTDLGTLPGGNHSVAYSVSADGSVVVGYSNNPNEGRAFRWTSAGMTDLGTLPGGNHSVAYGVSADGSVVVGYSNSANGGRAFRWTSAGMTDLGTLPGGNHSVAYGVSADGSVVVGYSNNPNEGRAFLYAHRVMLDVQDWLGSVGGVSSTLSTSLDLARTFTEGAHHRPLAELGRGKSYWATGDIAGSSRSRDLITRSGEAGVTFEPWTNVLAGVGAGYGRQDQQLLNDGSASTYGQYLVGELDFLLADGGILSVLVSSGDWQNETDRGYVTGGGVDYSHGETDIKSTSFRVRYDTPTLTQALGADLKAYVSYGQSRSRADGYDETGGSYAGSFSEMEQTAKEGRLGVAATRKLGEKLRGRLSAEWVRRFDRDQAAITATDITSTLDLTLPGAAVVRDQARFGFDLDYLMDAKTTLSFTVHAAGRGEVADVSGAVSLRKAF